MSRGPEDWYAALLAAGLALALAVGAGVTDRASAAGHGGRLGGLTFNYSTEGHSCKP